MQYLLTWPKGSSPQLKNKGKVVRGWLGVAIQKVTPDLAKTFGLKDAVGALVSDVTEGGPAARADIRRGDIIVTFAGRAVKEMDQLPRMVAAVEVGKKATVGLVREGRPIEVEVTIGEVADEKVREAEKGSPRWRRRSDWWSRISRPKSHTSSISGTAEE